MANLVEFIVKIKDLASGSVGRLASNAESSFNRMERGISRITGRMSSLRMSIRDIDRRLNDLRATREISLDGRQIRRINSEIAELERRRDRLDGGSTGGIGFGGLRSMVAGALAVAGVAGVGSVLNAGVERSLDQKSFEVMAGKQQGGQLSNNLIKYAQDSIYGNEVLGVGKMMLAFGIQTNSVMPSVQRLGDIAGGNAERLKGLGLAFSQVAAAGRLTGQDLLQFVNAGFNPLQVISEKTGKSLGVLKKEVEDGKVSFAQVADAINTATSKGGKFYQMTQQMGETAPGKLLALKGAFDGVVASAGQNLLEAMVPLIEFGQWMIDAPGLFNDLAVAIGIMGTAWGVYSVVTKWATISQWLLNIALMWPVILIVGIALAILALIARYQGWGKAMQALWTIIKAWVSNVGIAFKDFFQSVIYGAEMFWLKIKQTFQFIGGAVFNVMKALKLALQFKFSEAKEALFAEIKTKASAEIDTLEKNRKKQQAANLQDFAKNLNTIRNTTVLDKITVRKAAKGGTKSPLDIIAGGAAPEGQATPSSMGDANKGITSGGTKTLHITIGKFQDKTEIHTTNLTEGVSEIEDKLAEMYLRIVNSGGAAIG